MTQEQLVSDVKAFLYPVYKHRTLLEKAKYRYHGETVVNRQEGNDYISSLIGKRPAAVAKCGASEIRGLRHYLNHRDDQGNSKWWGRAAKELHVNTGVYPAEPAIFSRFCQIFLDAMGHLDAQGVWYRRGEESIHRHYAPRAKLIPLTSIEPYYHQNPWSRQLEGKRVVVITPFARSVLQQYQRRQEVWAKLPNLMPNFAELRTIRTPLSAALLEKPEYPTWFDAYDDLRRQMEAEPFDVCIVGAGAWSVPLVAHAKKLGAFGIHMGGGTQIFFGIKGKRWDNHNEISAFFNDSWTRPSKNETPGTIRQIENGCYW
jgi:hypothetical protein